MKKALCSAEYLIYIFLINIVTFALRPMSFTLINKDLIYMDADSILYTISNLTLFIVTTFVITWFFKAQNMALSFKKALFTFLKRVLPLSLIIRIIVDIIILLLNNVSGIIGTISSMIFEILIQFVVFYIVRKQFSADKVHRGKLSVIAVSLGIILLLGIIGWQIHVYNIAISDMEYISKKCIDYSYLNAVPSYSFNTQLINLLFNTILWIVLFIHYDIFKIHAIANSNLYRASKFVLRLICCFILSYLFVSAKSLILPHGVLSSINIDSKKSISHVYSENFDDNYSTITIERKTGFNSSNTVYVQTEVSLTHNNADVLTYKRKINQEPGKLHKLNVDGIESAYRYEFDVVAFYNNNVAFAIEFEEINEYKKKNETLIKICEQLIKDGYFEAFEYTHKYLLKYDKDFIQPYIQEYSNTASQFISFAGNSNINPTYITDFACSLETNVK